MCNPLRTSGELICRALHERVDWNLYLIYTLPVASLSRSSRARGLKFKIIHIYIKQFYRRALHERVDWNSFWLLHSVHIIRRALHERVDWNQIKFIHYLLKELVALFTSAWIEITYSHKSYYIWVVALLTSAWINHSPLPYFLSRNLSRALHERVDWNRSNPARRFYSNVALFERVD